MNVNRSSKLQDTKFLCVHAINMIISLSDFREGYKGDHKKKDGSAFQLLLREGGTYSLLSLKKIYN